MNRKSGFYPVRFVEGGQVFTYFYSNISNSWSSEPSSTDEYLEDCDFGEIGEMISDGITEPETYFSILKTFAEISLFVIAGLIIGSFLAVLIWILYLSE